MATYAEVLAAGVREELGENPIRRIVNLLQKMQSDQPPQLPGHLDRMEGRAFWWLRSLVCIVQPLFSGDLWMKRA